MTVLRTTRPESDRERLPRPRRAWPGLARSLAAWSGVVLVGVAGCSGGNPGGDTDRPPADPAPYRPLMHGLPQPSPDRIVYKAGTLTFYQLPASGRWMIQVGADGPSPVGTDHRLPDGVNPRSTYVSYCRPGGQVSGRVTLAQIQAAGKDHSSQTN